MSTLTRQGLGVSPKPKSPQINWNNSITRGLVFDAPFFQGGNTTTLETTQGLKGTIVASGATWDKNLLGIDLDFSAAASSVDFITPASVNSLSQLSVEVLFLKRGAGGGNLGRLINKGAGTGVDTRWFIFFDTAPSMTFATGYSTASDNWNVSLLNDVWHHAIFTMTIGTGIGTVPILYLNGVNTALTNSQVGSGTLATDTTALYVGNRASNNRNFDGKIAYSRIWNRLLTAGEARSLAIDPWQVYKKPTLFAQLSEQAQAAAVNQYWRNLMGVGV